MDNAVLKQQDYIEASGAAFSALSELLPVHAAEWFIRPIADFLKELCQAQHQNNLEPVFCISASVLRTSLLCGEPGYRLDAYGQDWALYDRPLLTRFIVCPWLVPIWSELIAHFQAALDRQEIQKFCYPLIADQAAWTCTGPLFSMIGSFLKYLSAPIKEEQVFQTLVKGNEFRIEFGEFLDWKIILAAEYPEVDIFNNRGHQFSHRQFLDKVFHQKKFYKFDLKGAVFKGCKFSDSTMEDSVFSDCLFERCMFKNTTFSNVLLTGAQFRECTLDGVVFENVIASFAGIPAEKVDDWYRVLSMSHTSMECVRFSGCDLRGSRLEQCTTTHTTLENTATDDSDFSILLSGDMEEVN